MNKDELKKYEEYLLIQKKWEVERFNTLLKVSPPLPPWIAYPHIEPSDMFSRMGDGESLMTDLHIYLKHISESEKTQYLNKYKEPIEWIGLYPKT
jgi:hypothetical protein